jgi:hypothetical protein
MAKRGGKVIHVDDELHARLRLFCDEHRTQMKLWVHDVLERAMERPTDPVEPKVEPEAKLPPIEKVVPITVEPVERKPMVVASNEPLDDEPWSRPPFWTHRSKPV